MQRLRKIVASKINEENFGKFFVLYFGFHLGAGSVYGVYEGVKEYRKDFNKSKNFYSKFLYPFCVGFKTILVMGSIGPVNYPLMFNEEYLTTKKYINNTKK